MNYTRATYRTASAMRNPVSTGSAGCLVGCFALTWQLFYFTALGTWWLLKITALCIYALVLLVWKGGEAAGSVFSKTRHQYLVGAGELSQADVAEVEAHQQLQPGVWYPGHGVIPKD